MKRPVYRDYNSLAYVHADTYQWLPHMCVSRQLCGNLLWERYPRPLLPCAMWEWRHLHYSKRKTILYIYIIFIYFFIAIDWILVSIESCCSSSWFARQTTLHIHVYRICNHIMMRTLKIQTQSLQVQGVFFLFHREFSYFSFFQHTLFKNLVVDFVGRLPLWVWTRIYRTALWNRDWWMPIQPLPEWWNMPCEFSSVAIL